MYPLIPTQSPYNTKSSPPTHDRIRIRTARHTPLSPPSPNSHPPYLPYIYHTQLHSRANSTPYQPDPRPYPQPSCTLSHPQTHLTPSQPDPHLNPTHLPHHTHSTYLPAKPSPLLSIYAHPAAKTLISPSKAHMSLGRFCCAMTIEYKCKTSNINKRL